VVSPFIGYAIYGALTVWTLMYRKKLQMRATATPAAPVRP